MKEWKEKGKKKKKRCGERVGKGKLCDAGFRKRNWACVCNLVQEIRTCSTRDRTKWFNGNGKYLKEYRWLSGTCFKNRRCVMRNCVCGKNSIREVLTLLAKTAYLRYTLEASLRCTHLSESIVAQIFFDFNSHPGRAESAGGKVALFQKVINLLQLFHDRYKEKCLGKNSYFRPIGNWSVHKRHELLIVRQLDSAFGWN